MHLFCILQQREYQIQFLCRTQSIDLSCSALPRGSSNPRSSFLTVMAIMTGGTQLVDEAHLTGGDMRFCRESSKSGSLFTLTQSLLNLRSCFAVLALLRLRAFWGALLAKIWRRGHKNILVDQGPTSSLNN